MITRFMDMHSGGRTKEEYDYIFIEAAEAEAKVIFYNRFGHNAERVTCTCCGKDYSIIQYESLEAATEWDYQRLGISFENYCKRDDVLIIRSSDIKESERVGEVPPQGYVWQD